MYKLNTTLILRYLKENNMSQKTFGLTVGINLIALNYYIKGVRIPTVEPLFRICDFLKIENPRDILINASHKREQVKVKEKTSIDFMGVECTQTMREVLKEISSSK